MVRRVLGLPGIRSTIEGGRGCNKCVPVLRGNGTKIAPTGYIFDQPPGGMSWVRGKLAGHVGGHVVLSPEEGVLVTSPGTESSYPRPSQLLNNSRVLVLLSLFHVVSSAFLPKPTLDEYRGSNKWKGLIPSHGKERKWDEGFRDFLVK